MIQDQQVVGYASLFTTWMQKPKCNCGSDILERRRPWAFSTCFVEKALMSVPNGLSLRRLSGLPFM